MLPQHLNDKFRQCGLDENIDTVDLKWIEESEESKHLLDWFIQFVDESNVLSVSEVNCYLFATESQSKSNLELTDEGNDNNLFADVTELESYFLDEDIAQLSGQFDVLHDVEQLLGKEIECSSKTLDNSAKELKNLQIELFKQSQALMKLSALNKGALNALSYSTSKYLSIFSDDKSDDGSKQNLFSQMDLNKFIHQCSRFDGQLQLYIKRVFKEPTLSGVFSTSTASVHDSSCGMFDLWSDQFGDIPQKMWQAGITKIFHQAQLSGIIHAETYLKKLQCDFPQMYINQFQMRMDVEMFQNEVESLTEGIDQSIKDTVGDVVQDIVLSTILSVCKKMALQRVERRRETLMKLSRSRIFVDNYYYLTKLVSILLKREAMLISFASDMLEETHSFLTEDVVKHGLVMDRMQNIEKQQNLWSTSPIKSRFSLIEALDRLLDSNVSEAGQVSLNQRNLFTAKLDSDVMERLSTHFDQLREGEQSLRDLCKALNCGITKKPVLYPSDLFCRLEECNLRLKSLNEESASLHNRFSKEKLALTSPTARIQRLLWAWFLAAPNRLDEALQLAAAHK